MIYVVDSNFFIQAHRATYPLDVVCSFWSKVAELAHAGKLISIDKVKQEIYDKNDALEEWCKANLPDGFFKDSSTTMVAYGKVAGWVISKQDHYVEKAMNEFLGYDEADALISHVTPALIQGFCVT